MFDLTTAMKDIEDARRWGGGRGSRLAIVILTGGGQKKRALFEVSLRAEERHVDAVAIYVGDAARHDRGRCALGREVEVLEGEVACIAVNEW